mgnify:CR=1 FL=1
MDRHTCRIVVVRALYEIDFRKFDAIDDQILDEIITYAIDPTKEFELPINWESYECNEENINFIKLTIKAIVNNLEEIDSTISGGLQNYTIDRLSYVDRAIIRLATYEMLKTDLAKQIAINEALEITKEYSNLDDGMQVKFNNRLLDNISKGIPNEQ